MNDPKTTDAISRSALRETLNKFKLSDDCMKYEWAIQAADDVAKYTIAAIKNAPTLDVAPVVHARWKQPPNFTRSLLFYCSKCGTHSHFKTRYCPECGARMDGEIDA